MCYFDTHVLKFQTTIIFPYRVAEGPFKYHVTLKMPNFTPTYLPVTLLSRLENTLPTYRHAWQFCRNFQQRHTFACGGSFSAKRRREGSFTRSYTLGRPDTKKARLPRNKSDNFCTLSASTLPLFSCFWLRHVTLTHDPTYLCVTLAVTLMPGPTYLGRAWRDIWMVPKAV